MTRDESLDDLEREVSVLMRRIKRVIGERARAVHEDLVPGSYLMLGYIADEGPVRASDMVEMFTIDKGAVSRQITHLLDLGLLERSPDPDDRRAHLLTVSDDGRRRLQDVKRHRRKLYDEKLGGWTVADLERFAADLASYNAALTDF